ncbi:hypothetical protein [Paenibacillus sp. 2TAB19]|uniref:hypothetical protein n=1 Tax=Paenibacillus sp. 2TAB19 TaxID=3233003 RepID=UPI003F9E5A62
MLVDVFLFVALFLFDLLLASICTASWLVVSSSSSVDSPAPVVVVEVSFTLSIFELPKMILPSFFTMTTFPIQQKNIESSIPS